MQISNREEIREIYEKLDFLEKGEKGTKSVRNSKKALGYVDYRVKFEFELYKKGENTYHIPPDDGDSVFRSAIFAFAVKKGFNYTNQFAKQ